MLTSTKPTIPYLSGINSKSTPQPTAKRLHQGRDEVLSAQSPYITLVRLLLGRLSLDLKKKTIRQRSTIDGERSQ